METKQSTYHLGMRASETRICIIHLDVLKENPSKIIIYRAPNPECCRKITETNNTKTEELTFDNIQNYLKCSGRLCKTGQLICSTHK